MKEKNAKNNKVEHLKRSSNPISFRTAPEAAEGVKTMTALILSRRAPWQYKEVQLRPVFDATSSHLSQRGTCTLQEGRDWSDCEIDESCLRATEELLQFLACIKSNIRSLILKNRSTTDSRYEEVQADEATSSQRIVIKFSGGYKCDPS